MTDRKISELPQRLELEDTDEFTTLSGGVNYRSPISAVSGGGASSDEGGAYYSSRAAALASEIPAEVNGIETLGYATPGDYGGAHYKRVVSEPTHEGKFQSADGAWWELAEVEVTLEMFGGKADATEYTVPVLSGTDNWPAFQAALGYGISQISANYGYSASIRLMAGVYRVNQTIEIDRSVRITGNGAAAVGNAIPQSSLTFPPDTTAFIFWSHNTPDPLPNGPAHVLLAYGSVLENIRIWGRGGMYLSPTTSTLTAHGIISYTTVTIRDCMIANFSGDGLHFESGTAAVPAGSANEIDLFAVRLQLNYRHGLFIDGADSSAGGGVRIDSSSNGGWGIWDSGYLGNGWVNCHTTNNALRGRVYHLGKRYWCIHNTLGGSTEPGTDAAVWEFVQNGGEDFFYPQWVSGRTYVPGGPYCTKAFLWPSPSQSDGFGHVFVNCYAEGGQASSRFNASTIYIGGVQGGSILSGPEAGTRNWVGGQVMVGGIGVRGKWGARQELVYDPHPGSSVMLGETDIKPITLYATGDNTTGLSFPNWNTTTGTFDINHGAASTAPPVKFTTSLTTGGGAVGRVAPLLPGRVIFPNDIFVGRSLTTARFIGFETVVPFVGPEYAQGDIVFNSAPSTGENVGWICTQGGMVSTTPAWASGSNIALNQHVQHLGRFYRCTFDAGSTSSVVEPSHTFTAAIVLADGYGWTYAGPVVALPGGPLPPTWKTGTDYAAGKQTSNTSGRSYVCTTDPGAVASTVMPTHTSGAVTGADGYGWTFTDLLWASGATYALDDIVKNSSDIAYRCSNVGAGTTSVQPTHDATATAADGTKWEFLTHIATTPAWVTGTAYKVGDIVETTGLDCHRVLIAGQGTSTYMPVHIYEHKTRTYGDGYKWEYLCSSWKSPLWVFGTTYNPVHSVEAFARIQNSAGNGYWCRLVNATTRLSTDPPVHTSGEVLAADYHRWLYITNQSPVWKTWGTVS